jgi:hypothetical protein
MPVKSGFAHGKIRRRFRPATKTCEDVSRGARVAAIRDLHKAEKELFCGMRDWAFFFDDKPPVGKTMMLWSLTG